MILPEFPNSLRILLCAGLVCVLSAPAQSQQAGSSGRQAPEGTRENPILFSIPDSLRSVVAIDSTLEFEAFEVRGRRLDRRPEGGRDLIGLGTVQSVDAGSAAELAPLLQSTRLSTNSRGESLFSVRGSSERHVGVFWDGIPLNVPWDERVDLALIPVDALGGVRAQRGMPDLRGGPQVLSGRVELLPWRLAQPGSETRIALGGGEIGAYEARLAHARRSEDGRWNLLVAGGRRERDAWVLPEDFAAPYHQGDGRLARSNSDQISNSALFSARHAFGDESELRLLLLGFDSEKGVPPEVHRNDARFWRYPKLRRGLAGLSGHAHVGNERAWRFSFASSVDAFRQEIRSFDDDSYSDPALLPGVEFEQDDDLTLYGRLGVRRDMRRLGSVELTAAGRRTLHDEMLVVDGPEQRYEQRLLSIVGEWEFPLAAGLEARIGLGFDRASTPRAGDGESSDPSEEANWLLSLEHAPQDSWHWALRYSRRGRAPSLREAYSGALGRFVVNPSLGPELQDLFELDLSREFSRVSFAGALFASFVDGAIERVALPGNSFQRENVEDLRVLGVELAAQIVLPARFRAGGQFTALHARVRENGEFSGYAEDRPEFLSSLWLGWVHPAGWKLRLENQSVGARASAGADGLLAPHTRWNLRLAYLFFGGPGPLSETELFARVDNLLDATSWSQVGLPEPGQSLWLGARFSLR